MIQIIKVVESDKKDKRFCAIMNNGKMFDFGSKNGKTYIDGRTDLEKINYIKRHQENPLEKKLIKNLVLSPSVLSLYLLWNTKDMDENIKILNELFRKNYDKL